MTLSSQIAKHFHEVHFGDNWTEVNLKQTLSDVRLEEAIIKIDSLNSIAALVYHCHYFVHALLGVLKENKLNAHDKFSMDAPPMNNEMEWQNFLKMTFDEALETVALIEKLPESTWWGNFTDAKYGNWYKNVNGTIEHTHYHLGQISLLKKMIRLSYSS